MTFFEAVKNIFLLLLFLQLAPSLIQGITKHYGRYLSPRTAVAVVPIKGVISESNRYTTMLEKFFDNTDIKAILLRIDCQGTVTGSGQSIFDELMFLKKEHRKPVIALVENMCASGGYLIASAADYIIAPSTALIGSIGNTFSYFFQLNKLLAYHNIGYVPLKAGEYKLATDPFTDITPQEQALLQNVLDDAYDQFKTNIAQTRKVSLDESTTWAEGKIFTGRQALKIGLIDEVGSISTAKRVLKEKALIESEIEWVHPPKSGGFLNALFGGDAIGDDETFMSACSTALVSTLEQKIGAPSLR